MQIFSKSHLLLDYDVKSQKAAFELIANLAFDLKVVSNKAKLVNGLVAREKASTTGMAAGFAIPHTMNDCVNRPAIIITRFKNPVEWNSFDKKPVKVAIALLIPKNKASTLHMKYLSRVATALMDPKFTETLLVSNSTNEITKLIDDAIKSKKVTLESTTSKNLNNKYIIGVTACATGIAHTYMAKEALVKAAQALKYQYDFETEGQNGIEHPLTKEMINKADAVIVAVDIAVDTDRFINKKVLFCDTNQAINKPTETIKKALAIKNIFLGKNKPLGGGADVFATEKNGFMKHFLSGVSKMIPFIVFSGIVYAIINAIVMGLYPDGLPPEFIDLGAGLIPNPEYSSSVQTWNLLLSIAGVGFTLFIGVMGAYIADSVGGRAAFGPGFMATFVASTPAMYFFWNGLIPNEMVLQTAAGGNVIITGISLSIFAALIMGFAAGFLVKWFNTFKIHKLMRPLMSILIIPVVCTCILIFPFVFLLSGPLGYLMNGFAWLLATAGMINGVNFLIGFLLGFMVGFDMGGPINKIATATATALIVVDPRLMGAVAAAIPIAPFGCGLATFVGRKMFDENEKALGVSSMALGFMGISEGALPFAAKRPKQVIIANVIASGIAGGLAFLFCVGGHVGMWGGPIDAIVLGIYADNMNGMFNFPEIFSAGNGFIAVLWFFIAMIAGALIHAFLLIGLIKISEGTGRFSQWKIWKILHLTSNSTNKVKELENKIIYRHRIQDLSYIFNLFK